MGKRYLAVGGTIITEVANYNVMDDLKYKKCNSSKDVIYTRVSFKNVGFASLTFIVNGGEEMPLDVGESFSCGDYDVYSLIIKEVGSSIRWSGFGCVGTI